MCILSTGKDVRACALAFALLVLSRSPLGTCVGDVHSARFQGGFVNKCNETYTSKPLMLFQMLWSLCVLTLSYTVEAQVNMHLYVCVL
jgi:hypothetical protein